MPKDRFLLSKNKIVFEGEKLFADELHNKIVQKTNSSKLGIPLNLWFYNLIPSKYDSILNEYMQQPFEFRSPKNLDSLYIKYNKPEWLGKRLFWPRVWRNFGTPPVLYNESANKISANNIRIYLSNKGYWRAKVNFEVEVDEQTKKAIVIYKVLLNQPTIIKDYTINIKDSSISNIYNQNLDKVLVKKADKLDQNILEKERNRINNLVRDNGYTSFNLTNEEISFSADTLRDSRLVPLEMKVEKLDSSKYFKTRLDSINVYISNVWNKGKTYKKERIRSINLFKQDSSFTNSTFYRAIILKSGDLYDPKNISLTKQNLNVLGNFENIKFEEERRSANDSIMDIRIYLKKQATYDFLTSTDVHYSQILNFGFSPTVSLISRNLFGGAENLTTSLSGIIGTTNNGKNPNQTFNAWEVSFQNQLSIPRLLLPFSPNKWIPKRYSPTTNIILGTSAQHNIGLGRIGLNAGINYNIRVNDRISHSFSIFNTQFNLTQNKDNYYDLYPVDRTIRNDFFGLYFAQNPNLEILYNSQNISSDQVSRMILNDDNFNINLDENGKNTRLLFIQSLLNKDRQTQDALINSLIYNFNYNEMNDNYYTNPSRFDFTVEFAGNLLSLFKIKDASQVGVSNDNVSRTLFGIPYSQFVKFDIDYRKYFKINNRNKLVFRQFIGLGIPYGNSSQNMPFVRSYFNGGSRDIRAWRAFEGLGPSDSQIDKQLRAFIMTNVKLTTNLEYRFRLTDMIEGAGFVDAGNIWSLTPNEGNYAFKFQDFYKQLGIGGGFGLRFNVAYITAVLDVAYKFHDPNRSLGDRWVLKHIKPLQPTLNLAIGYPF